MTAPAIRADSLSPWQQQAMAVPEQYDLALTGGRGGGKTRLLGALFLRHCEQYGARARCLIVRRSFPGLQDLEQELIAFFFEVYGNACRFDGQKHIFRLPNGATIQLDQLERESDYLKFQGKSFTHIAADEAGQWAGPALVDRLRASLRAPEGVPTKIFPAGKPRWRWPSLGGSASCAACIVATIYHEASGAEFVTIASTYRDNPYIDQVKYRQNLRAACAVDPELAKAWLDGDWSVIRGAFFASVLDEHRVMIEPWPRIPQRSSTRIKPEWEWRPFLAHDYGSAAPA